MPNQKDLINKIIETQKSSVSNKINERYYEFKSFSSKSEEAWFSELCFCITTANCSAESGIKVQQALGFEGFYNLPKQSLAKKLQSLGYRFYNKRAEYICEARKHFGIKEKLKSFSSEKEKRLYLVNNVKGFSFKEASHFLRNTGHENLAILDRHILKVLHEYSLLDEIPKTLNEKKYLQIEEILTNFCSKLNLNQSLLDLYLWYLKTGKVLK
ncbi:MAG: N-glycosylase/DNA lyase [Candidatus Diapherotrites archaeon]